MICDKCNENHNLVGSVYIRITEVYEAGYKEGEIKLCSSCYDDFENWFKMKVEK